MSLNQMIHPVYIISLLLTFISIGVISFLSKPKTLLTIITTDDEYKYIDEIYQSIKGLIGRYHVDLLIVCRDSDVKTQDKWKQIDENVLLATVNHYNIYKTPNLIGIRNKRNVAIDVATKYGYEYLLFLESNVIFNENIYKSLINGMINYDVCLLPTLNNVYIKNNNDYTLQPICNDKNYKECFGGDTNRIIISRKVFTNIKFNIKAIEFTCNIKTNTNNNINNNTNNNIKTQEKTQQKIRNENIGFYLDTYKNGYKVCYISQE